MTENRRIAALGSSFAAGPGIEPVDDPVAMRSARNYPHLFAQALGADLVDLTVSGASTATILDTPQLMMNGTQYPPQIEGLPADADTVTVTAGGNDLHLAVSMLYAAWARHDPAGVVTQMLKPNFTKGIPEPTASDVDVVAAGLARIVAETRTRATGARIILVDYLTMVTEDTTPGDGIPFSSEEISAFLEIQSALARAYQIAAERSGAELLAMSAVSRRHGLGSADPWVFDFQPTIEKTACSFHPNETGMYAVAGQLLQILHEPADAVDPCGKIGN